MSASYLELDVFLAHDLVLCSRSPDTLKPHLLPGLDHAIKTTLAADRRELTWYTTPGKAFVAAIKMLNRLGGGREEKLRGTDKRDRRDRSQCPTR